MREREKERKVGEDASFFANVVFLQRRRRRQRQRRATASQPKKRNLNVETKDAQLSPLSLPFSLSLLSHSPTPHTFSPTQSKEKHT